MADMLKIPVEEYTSPSPLQVGPNVTIDKIIAMMMDQGVRHIPVVEDGIAVGIISERDLAVLTRHIHVDRVVAAEVMSLEPYHVPTDTPLDEVAFELSARKIGSAIVTDAAGKIVGIFTVTDALNALIELLRGEIKSQQLAQGAKDSSDAIN